MYKPISAIEVRIWEKTVGAVALDPNLGFYAFEYAPEFLKTGIELAPLTMPLAQGDQPFIFADLPPLTYNKLPGMLADALPDEFGNLLIDAWMSTKGIDKSGITALDRLAYMGQRGTGALEFKPARSPSVVGTAIKLSNLVESARIAVSENVGTDKLANAALAQMIRVGTSAGGARAKAAIAWNPKTDELRSGQFNVDPGFEHWLLKFDGIGTDWELGGSQDYGRIEYAYYLMARDAGINITSCRLLNENGRSHFMTKRFDRDGNKKHHLQTLCAMAHLDFRQKATHDYNQLFEIIYKLSLGYSALEEAFRRMAFNVMAANCDDHSKNFSFILREGKDWELAPAYDLTHAHNPKGEWTYQHLMSVQGKFTGFVREDLLAIAERYSIGTAGKVLDQVSEAVSAWPIFALQAEVGPHEIARIKSHHTIL